jgi:hypothetical protein
MPRRGFDRVGAVKYPFILALAPFLLGSVSSAKQNAPLPTNSAVGLPEFAKNVRVKCAGSDVPLGDIVRQRASDPQISSYRELRKANDGSVDGQRELARWCRKQHLAEEEQLHWRIVLSMHQGDAEAIKALKLKNYRGMLLTSDEIDNVKQNEKDFDEAAKSWLPKLTKLKHSIEHGNADEREAALRELKAIQDPRAIPSLEEVFGVETGIGLEVVDVLAKMNVDEAAAPLARMAVQSSDQYVREKAAEALQRRPYETYVPMLIGRLAAPIEMSVDVSVVPGKQKWQKVQWEEFTGQVVPFFYDKYRLHSAYQRSDVVAWTFETAPKSGYMMTENVPDHLRYKYSLSRDSPDSDRPVERLGTIDDQSTKKKSRKSESIGDVEQRVNDANAKQAALNEKIHAALNAATGANLPPGNSPRGQFEDVKPKLWWDWWKQKSHTDRYFAAGTLVWTELGLLPIEQILVGDRVLTRDAASGDLTFQLVIATNSQSKGSFRVVSFGSGTLTVTSDQQFHSASKGWKRVDELEATAQIDGLVEPHAIDDIADGSVTAGFAIVTPKAADFFVGEQGILAHDATSSLFK